MHWHKIIGLMEARYLHEVAQAYKNITEIHNSQLHHLEERWKNASTEADECGRSYKDILEEDLGEQAYANEQIQQIVYRSYIVTICMTIEEELRRLSRHLQRRHGERFSLQDIRGTGIKACVSYIRIMTGKNLLIEIPDIELLVRLRNLIVHQNGSVSKEDSAGLKSISAGSSLHFDFHDEKIFIHAESLDGYLEFFKTVMAKISEYSSYEEP